MCLLVACWNQTFYRHRKNPHPQGHRHQTRHHRQSGVEELRLGDASIAFQRPSRQFAVSSRGLRTMRCTKFFVASSVALAATLMMAIHFGMGPAAAKGVKPPFCRPGLVPKCVLFTDHYRNCLKWTCAPPAPYPCKGPPSCPLGSTAVCTKKCGHHSCSEWTCAPRPPKPPMTKEPFGGPKPLPRKRLPRGNGRGVPSGGVLEPNFQSPSQKPAPTGTPAPSAPPSVIIR